MHSHADPSSGCRNGDVRLVNQGNEHSGRVELCVGGVWKSLCVDQLFHVWSNRNAQVVCRQLGYENVESKAFYIANRQVNM